MLTKNFPGRKQKRRIRAAIQLEGNVASLRNNFPSKKNEILFIESELKTLDERIKKGGKRSTKKIRVGLRQPK